MKKLQFLLFLWITIPAFAQVYFPKNDGVSQNPNTLITIENATIVVSPSEQLQNATLLIKDGKIIKIGAIEIPKNAKRINATGKTIYPSFIDLFSNFGVDLKKERVRGSYYDSTRDGFYWNEHINTHINAADYLSFDTKKANALQKIGFGSVVSHSKDGILSGTGVLWTLNTSKNNSFRVLEDKISNHFSFNRSIYSGQSYPSSLMGSMALIRQFLHDSEWYKSGSAKNKDRSIDAYIENNKKIAIFETDDKLDALRAAKIGKEFNIPFLIKGDGYEFERIAEIKETGNTFIVPLNFPKAYDTSDPFLAQQINLSDLKRWQQAPFNLSVLEKNDVPYILTAVDNKTESEFLDNLRLAVKKGASKTKILEALTTAPAKLLGKENQIGSLKKGSLANFFIASEDIFNTDAKIIEHWIQGEQNKIEKLENIDLKGLYTLEIDTENYELEISGEATDWKAKITKDSISYGTKLIVNDTDWLNFIIKGKDSLQANFIRLTGIKNKQNLEGNGFLENGKAIKWSAVFKEKKAEEEKEEKTDEKEVKEEKMIAVTFPNLAYGNEVLPKKESILIQNTTVWTNEKDGVLKNTDVYLENGKIKAIGKNLSQKANITIDGTNKHVTAGLIDEHSHIAISNGVNEGGQNCTAEVTIEDVVDSEDINIYRNLSGGVTTSNLLHGSANPIGGRAALIKLKWGENVDDLKFKDHPKYIKFALGENVKQSNWGNRTRYPQTRMGVEQIYEDYFSRAIAYKKEWDAFAKNSKKNSKPRYDIEMEVLNEILNNERFITCHSYVQSEINMLIKLAERYNFKIQTFTHILEGYKVADKMADHGVAGSTFADWWGYKYEVKDAIPYNAALMQEQGVVVSINSDDAEMSRRLNQEAAKTIKYGGLSEEEALKLVTLNPAKILQVDDKIGSIKIGKDADVVVWTDNPLSIYATVDKTIIEGTIYYDAAKEEAKLTAQNELKNQLINEMILAKNKGLKTQIPTKKEVKHYHCDTLEHLHLHE